MRPHLPFAQNSHPVGEKLQGGALPSTTKTNLDPQKNFGGGKKKMKTTLNFGEEEPALCMDTGYVGNFMLQEARN